MAQIIPTSATFARDILRRAQDLITKDSEVSAASLDSQYATEISLWLNQLTPQILEEADIMAHGGYVVDGGEDMYQDLPTPDDDIPMEDAIADSSTLSTPGLDFNGALEEVPLDYVVKGAEK